MKSPYKNAFPDHSYVDADEVDDLKDLWKRTASAEWGVELMRGKFAGDENAFEIVSSSGYTIAQNLDKDDAEFIAQVHRVAPPLIAMHRDPEQRPEPVLEDDLPPFPEGHQTSSIGWFTYFLFCLTFVLIFAGGAVIWNEIFEAVARCPGA